MVQLPSTTEFLVHSLDILANLIKQLVTAFPVAVSVQTSGMGSSWQVSLAFSSNLHKKWTPELEEAGYISAVEQEGTSVLQKQNKFCCKNLVFTSVK